LASTLKAVRQI